ncbi:hypothetical protein BGW80DRAFT_1562230 [Lactifluus volemus]|nr:hypothetical protein BGW80DRAFT_1562230 [Lactifluus volemus]
MDLVNTKKRRKSIALTIGELYNNDVGGNKTLSSGSPTAINGTRTHASHLSPGTAVSTTSLPPLPPSSTSSSGLPIPSTSGTSTPVHPPFVLLPSQSQQQPGAAATATALTSPVPVPAPAASSAAATATPALRGWDTQSMHADAMGPFLLELAPVLEATLARRVEYSRDLV